MKQDTQELGQQTYIPVDEISQITTQHMLAKVLVATREHPEDVCGMAKRVGYTGKSNNDLAIYRLKVRDGASRVVFTLPNLFVVEEGVFKEYEAWRLSR